MMLDKAILELVDGLEFGDYLASETAIRAAQEMVKKGSAVLILKALMLAHANGEGCVANSLQFDAKCAHSEARWRIQSVYREVGDD